MISEPKNKPDTRHLVYQVICAVDEKNFPLDQALEDCFSKADNLDPRDRAFIKNLATTLFRHLAFIDKHISSFLKRPLQKRALWVRHWLRIGAAQILFLDVPDHAAVNTSVDAVGNSKRSGAKVFRGLTNGVLRNVIRGKERILADLEKNPDGILPRWIKGRWSDFYGEKTVSKICRVLKTQPPLDVSVKDPEKIEVLAKELGANEIYPGTLRFRPKGPITTLPGFRDGDWWAQDLAASLPPRLLGNVKGKRVLDLCAAPGGKTLFLAAQGAFVTAVDISKTRIEMVKENLTRTGLSAEVINQDVRKFRTGNLFDFILLDPPCSATGTLRRHPDVPYHRGKADIERLAGLQLQMLDHAMTQLKPGGVLIYCVCSLEKEESEDLIEAFLKITSGVKRVAIKPSELEGHKDWITKAGDLRTLPCHLGDKGGMDGFFAARLTRV